MAAYYNEIDPYAAQWLRNLISAGHIAPGDVDERSILAVAPDDLRGYAQCHFFAGIGGWSYALRLAQWPDDAPVWTGSCPCQPFSVAGLGRGMDDERHLWPFWFHLIEQCRPTVVFGEQVEGAIKHGWLDDLQADMEREGYSVGAAVLGAHSVDAPHIRKRLYWLANSESNGGRWRVAMEGFKPEKPRGPGENIRATKWPVSFGSGKAEHIPEILQKSYGVPARVVRLRAYGNAIVPQVAAEFITAFMECRP